MSAHIAVLNLPAAGHILPTLGVVSELVERGHRVSYVAVEGYADAVKAAGAEHVPYVSAMEGKRPPMELTPDIVAQAPLAFLNESKSVAGALEERFPRGGPDLLMYDASVAAAGRQLGSGWGCRGVRTFPTLTFNEHYRFDEKLTADLAIDPTHPALVEFGRALADMTGVIPEHDLVFVPREFQPAGETFGAETTFVGPCIADRAHQGRWSADATGKLLYVSLGTAFTLRPEFFRECVRAAALMPDWRVVMAIGDRVTRDELGTLPPNVEVRAHVPQLEVLRHATVFLSHAGMGSTMEAMYFGVPLVTVPQMVEQEINAGRVVELALGLRLDRRTVDAAQIVDAVLAVAASDEIRANVTKMARYARRAGGAVAAADAIERHLAGG
ncbi:macrolide family glycosyltransferase [Fodinicola acaciae]|uniref:macrolide family glycosyltransferase n=1 Tax=Fodinicola acaciae TaxID=2681555 RepID=UPI0013D4482B|nr:macrolide family glycosyltransferase [Fodinicola acaciae]